MPYVNIPNSGLAVGIAKIVGKLQGSISSKILKKTNEVQSKFRTVGCPSLNNINRLDNQKQQLERNINNIGNRLSRFRRLPKKLKAPLTGLKAALKIILTLPIPQSVPPGFGLPINITTKYADIMHLLKELISQIDEIIQSLEVVLETPSNQLSGITPILSRLDTAIASCKTEAALQSELDSGNISKDFLKDIGLMDEEEIYIFSNLGPRLVGNVDSEGNNLETSIGVTSDTFKGINSKVEFDSNYPPFGEPGNKIGERRYLDPPGEWFIWTGTAWISELKNKDLVDQLNKTIRQGQDDDLDNTTKTLSDALDKLQDSNISEDIKNNLNSILDNFINLNTQTKDNDSRFYHTGPDGTVYKLDIITDPNSPSIAPRRYAVALNKEGVEVLKGGKSFASEVDILLDEVKFRIDNQLP